MVWSKPQVNPGENVLPRPISIIPTVLVVIKFLTVQTLLSNLGELFDFVGKVCRIPNFIKFVGRICNFLGFCNNFLLASSISSGMRLLTAITDRLSPEQMEDVATKRVRADEMKAKNNAKKPIAEDRFLTYLTLRGIVDDLKLRRTGDKHGELSARRDEGQKILVEGLPYTFDPSVLQRTNKFKLTYKQKDICDLDISSLRRVALNLVAIYVIAFAQIIDTVRKTFFRPCITPASSILSEFTTVDLVHLLYYMFVPRPLQAIFHDTGPARNNRKKSRSKGGGRCSTPEKQLSYFEATKTTRSSKNKPAKWAGDLRIMSWDIVASVKVGDLYDGELLLPGAAGNVEADNIGNMSLKEFLGLSHLKAENVFLLDDRGGAPDSRLKLDWCPRGKNTSGMPVNTLACAMRILQFAAFIIGRPPGIICALGSINKEEAGKINHNIPGVENPIDPSSVKGTPAFEALYIHQKWVAAQVSMMEALHHYRKDGGKALQPVTVSTAAASCMNVLRMVILRDAIPEGQQNLGYPTYVADLSNYATVRTLTTTLR